MAMNGATKTKTELVAELGELRRRLVESESQKMEALGILAGGIAHNFNNLLQVMLGGISIIETNLDQNHQNNEYYSMVKESIKKGSELTGQLLNFSQPEKHSEKLIGLNEVVIGIASMFFDEHKNIDIVYQLDDDLHEIAGDQSQIEQVLLNILQNAFQAMPDGGLVTIQTKNISHGNGPALPLVLRGGDLVSLTIADTGMGINEKTQKRVFDPFFTTRGVGEGSGLGLASALGLVKNHGGTITVESEPQKGAAFQIYFPAANGKIVEAEALPAKTPFGIEALPSGLGQSVFESVPR